MSRAWNMTRMEVDYRHHAFSSGLRACGYEVRGGDPQDPAPGDVLLIWNRYGVAHSIASRFEAAGGTVLVAENGYLGPRGTSPHSMKPREWYALGRGFHNDSTTIRPGDPKRFEALDVTLNRWRPHGSHFLICPNRNFGTPGRIMPNDWCSVTRRTLKALSKRESRIRPHPGNNDPRVPLADDLANCWAVVIWNSSAGIQALIRGIPVICCGPNWICKPAGLTLDESGMRQLDTLAEKSNHAYTMRDTALGNMAWSQWHVDEIASGAAFAWTIWK